MAAGSVHNGSQEDPPISDKAARQIAGRFKVAQAEVILDARQVSAWGGSSDDLLVWLEHRHVWNARRALAYLLSLRTALHSEVVDRTDAIDHSILREENCYTALERVQMIRAGWNDAAWGRPHRAVPGPIAHFYYEVGYSGGLIFRKRGKPTRTS